MDQIVVRTRNVLHLHSTFSNKSYEGNYGLCGAPLSFPCGNDDATKSIPNSSLGWRKTPIKSANIFEPIGVVIGYVAFIVGWFTWDFTRRKMG